MSIPVLPPFKNAQFILASDGSVLEASSSGKALLKALGGAGSLGFRELLLGACPAWIDLVPPHWNTAIEDRFLPWLNGEDEFGPSGLRMSVLPCEDRSFVSLSPAIAKNPRLKDASLGEFPVSEDIVSQLALRLRSTENRLSNYLNNYPGVFFSQRPDLSFSYVGSAFEGISGLPPAAFYKHSGQFLNLIHEEDIDHVLHTLERNKNATEPFSLTYRLRHPVKNTVLYLLDFRVPVASPGGLFLGYDGVWLDNTRQAIAEKSLQSTTWKATLGTVTAGLLHDFSNIISGIFTLSEIYTSSLSEDHPMAEGMGQILKNSKEGQRLIRRIIDLNREEKNQRSYHNLDALVREQLDLIAVILPKRARLESLIDPEQSFPVYVDAVAFRQVLLNLAMNARDALVQEGCLSVRVEGVEQGERVLDHLGEQGCRHAPSSGVRMVVKDDGVGIPAKQFQKIFAPYFSTKDITKGSGFGLYNAELFVRSHGGCIGVESTEGVGSSFEVYLPLATFDEASPEDEVDSHIFSKERPRCVVYSARESSEFELVRALREDGWELACVASQEELFLHIEHTPIAPDIFLAIDIAGDPAVESLLQYMRTECPEVRRLLQVYGSNPDAVDPKLKASVESVFDERYTSQEVVKKMLDRVVLYDGTQ